MRRSAILGTVWLSLLAALSGSINPVVADDREQFPRELVEFTPHTANPVFTARGSKHWDAKLRERGWILREGTTYRMWFTGYDGTREGVKKLGYATSADGIHWKRRDQPIYDDHWIEDMMVVKQGDTYYMFAEGVDNSSFLLTSADGLRWKHRGNLDIRDTDGKPLSPGPYGTPTAYYEDGIWYLFYERMDQGVWLATSKDLKVWTHVQDEPVLTLGPETHDSLMIALNQIVKHKGYYYAYYHGTGTPKKPRDWSSCIAVSDDLVHWKKYVDNPILRENKSSPLLVDDGKGFRLYSMHDQVALHFPKSNAATVRSAPAKAIVCAGTYKHHLQGVCADEKSIYWSFTTTLVKTDQQGQVVKKIPVRNHHGDLCHHDGKLYVAVNFGRFNHPEGKADSWVIVYDAKNLAELTRHHVPEVFHGAGGMAVREGRFFVVGGLPGDVQVNYVYEYDAKFQFTKKHIIKSGQTHLGIQSAAFINGKFWFGCYGSPNILLVTDADFKMLGRHVFNCSLGIEKLGKDGFWVASGVCKKGKGCTGRISAAKADPEKGLKLLAP